MNEVSLWPHIMDLTKIHGFNCGHDSHSLHVSCDTLHPSN